MTTFVRAATVLAATLAIMCGRAESRVELCPATLEAPRPAPARTGASASSFAYVLGAGTPRTIQGATFAADTDKGWYVWKVGTVSLPAAIETSTYHGVTLKIPNARSGRLSVDFPSPVRVYHAWVMAAQTDGHSGTAWDAAGNAPCEIPAFVDRDGSSAISKRPLAFIPAPAADDVVANIPPAIAAPAPQPFATLDCAAPFRVARVTEAVTPDYPSSERTAVTDTRMSAIEVTIDERGHPMDESPYMSSGVAPFDLAATRAARTSQYAPAISYCQNVKGQYLFLASFMQ